MLYTIEFSLEQLGQVKWITYPDLIPTTVGFTELFIIVSICADVFTTIWIVNIIQSELSHSDTCAPGIMFDGRIAIRIPSKRRMHAQIFLAVLY